MSSLGSRSWLVVLLACCAAAAAHSKAATIDADTFASDLQALTHQPHRRAGFGWDAPDPTKVPGSYGASMYIEKRLRQIGFAPGKDDAELFIQTFPVVQYESTQCQLSIGSETYGNEDGFYPCRPNLLQASVTPAEGITGQLLYAGTGQVDEFGNGPVKDKIVVMEYDCGKNWLRAFAFGARAVIFIGQQYRPDEPPVNPYHHINLPSNLPRFYVTPELAEALDLRHRDETVVIKAACRWGQKRGRNVIAVLRGTAPKFADDKPKQALLLAAPIDSLSEVPDLSGGARDAANCAGLLQVAEYLMHNRPKRDVIIAFFDGQTLNHMGARAFYGALMRRWKTIGPKTLDELRAMTVEERSFQQSVLRVLDEQDLFGGKAKSLENHQEAILFLRQEARGIGGEVLDELRPLRLKAADLKRDLKTLRQQREELSNSPQPDAEKLKELDEQIAELDKQIERIEQWIGKADVGGLAKEDMDWNRVERYLFEQKSFDEIEERIAKVRSEKARAAKRKEWQDVRGKLKLLVEHARRLAQQRIREIDRELEEFDEAIRLRDAIGYENETIVLHISFNLGDARRRWTFIHGDDTTITLDQDKSGNYTGVFATMMQVHRRLNGLTQLTSQDINDLPALCSALISDSGKDNIGGRILGKIDESVLQILQQVAAQPQSLQPAWRSRILKALNKALDDRGLWQRKDFASRKLSRQDRRLVQLDRAQLRREDVRRLNRLALEATYGELLEQSPSQRVAPSFDPRAISGLYEMHHFAPSLFVDSGAVARLFSIYNVAAMTVMDPLDRQGHPFDTPQVLHAETIAAQISQIAPFIKVLADDEGLNLTNSIRPDARYHDALWSGNKSHGGSVMRAGGGSAMADRPVRGALVAIMSTGSGGGWRGMLVEKVPPGFVYPVVVQTGIYGTFGVPPISYLRHRNGVGFFACLMDKPNPAGDATYGAQQAQAIQSRGIIDFVVDTLTFPAKKEAISDMTRAAINLFKTHAKTIVGYGYDRGAIVSIPMWAASTAKFRDDRHLLCEVENVVTIFAPYDAKGFKLFNKAGEVLLNNDKQAFTGRGISLADQWEHPNTIAVTAHDLQMLNEGRLDLLRDNHINQESLEILNARAHDLREDAEQRETPDGRMGNLAAAAAMARRAYIPLVNVLKDLVTAVVLLLLLAIPFAYALERLLIGTPHIYRQIGWFTLLFVLTFAVLYMVNPAFRLAATPIVIFLAFAIILLSSLVIFIMTRKLQTEIKRMQGLAATVHAADVSRLSTMMAAVHMGISTMRRRPLRTLLTAATVVLLTFTILTFASFGTSWGTRRTYEETLSGPPRILVRHQLWNPIGEGIYDALRGYLIDKAEIVPRRWIAPTATDIKDAQTTDVNFERLVTTAEGDYLAPVAAAIGIDKRDIDRQPKLRELFDGRIDLLESDGIFLTDAVREELNLDKDDVGQAKVLYLGHAFTYAGVVTDQLAGFTMLEGSSMLPVDYHSSGGGSVESFTQDQATAATQTLSEMPDVESAQFVTYNLHMNVIIPVAFAERLGGGIRSITIYPNDVAGIQQMAQNVARVSELPTYVGDSGGVHRLIFTSLATASGWRDLMIPISLGGLIIFATMLGSVSDREREIYTFSSLGLAPPHVASLFFAEASVYAVIGGMGGYLLGQVVARIMGWFASMGYVSVPSMNYSSTNAIVTILIVMCTVLISTIYPAAKASRSANPGIQRSWKIPAPQGDLYDLLFPFTVSAYDITGVVSFLKEHFDNYTDTSLGVFATTKCHIFRQRDNDMLGFAATVALAPFDLGVTQNFVLLSQPSEIEGIDEVRALLYRLSGARGDWQRSNRVFINELRKQLLIWRSLRPDVMDRYRQMTLSQWDSLPREHYDGTTIGEMA